MPTGYTQKLYEGEQSFTEFVSRCARGMMPLVTLREEPMDKPLPVKLEPYTQYHEEQITKAEDRLAWLRGLTCSQCEAEAEKEYRELVNVQAELDARRVERRARYQAMHAQVLAWEPPTPDHENFRAFMLNQLEESMDYDCAPSGMPAPTLQMGLEWQAATEARILRDLEYHRTQLRQEIERTNERNAWLTALRESLNL